MRVLMPVMVVLAMGVASAEPEPGAFTSFGDLEFLGLLKREAVQKDVKMTPVQVEKLTPAYLGYVRRSNELFRAAKDQLGPNTPPAEHTRVRLRISAEVHKEFLKEITELLRPDQIKRVRQIRLQSLGSLAFREPEVIEKLGLTDAQRKDMATIALRADREGTAVLEEPFAGLTNETIRERANRLREIHKKQYEATVGVLSARQKKVWQGMIGTPFDLRALEYTIRWKRESLP